VLYFLDTDDESSSTLSANLTQLIRDLSENDRYFVQVAAMTACGNGLWFCFELIEGDDEPDPEQPDGPTH
jgi:hypothetical protein